MSSKTHPHYYKVCPYNEIDVYRVLLLFGVTDPCLQHAIKKLLVPGKRGQKDATKDVAEAIVTLQRFVAMRAEEEPKVDGPLEWRCPSCGNQGTGIPVHKPDCFLHQMLPVPIG